MSRFILMASMSFPFGVLAILAGASAYVLLGWCGVDKDVANPISWAVVGSCWTVCMLATWNAVAK